MSVVNTIADAVAAAILALPAVQEVTRIDSPASRESIEAVSMKLPGVIIAVLEDGFSTRAGRDNPRKGSVDLAAIVVTKPIAAERSKRYASAWVQAWTIQMAVKTLITQNDWGLGSLGVAKALQPLSRPVPKVSIKAGHAAIVMSWEQEYDIPAAVALDDLEDLRDVVVDIDHDDDGETEHTTHVGGLEA